MTRILGGCINVIRDYLRAHHLCIDDVHFNEYCRTYATILDSLIGVPGVINGIWIARVQIARACKTWLRLLLVQFL